MSRERQPWLMPIALLVAFLLSVVPVAPELQPLRPAWVALVLAYWIIESPGRVGMALAFALGILQDLIVGGMLGENALRLVVVTFILLRFRARIRFFPLTQQAAIIALILFNDRIISVALHAFWRLPAAPWTAWLTPMIGFALWPILFIAIDSLRLRGWGR